MKKILLVKTSSLGDVVHNLPVASDIRAALPDAAIDWVVEDAFGPIPRLHPAVGRVLPVAIRRWRIRLLDGGVRAEVRAFLQALRQTAYDAVIDTQGLLKSALIARAARGTRCGLDFASAREPLSLLYDRTYRVPWTMHAVERNRALAAQALGYKPTPAVDYGIRARGGPFAWLPAGRYAVLLHVTSAANKLWAEESWVTVGARLNSKDIRSVLPWGNSSERARSERLAGGIGNAIVPPALKLEEMAAVLAGATAVVGVDTGLTHLAGALGVPTVGVYGGPWAPSATGVYGCARAVNLGEPGRPPAAQAVLAALDQLGG